jgi:hypothetical protein
MDPLYPRDLPVATAKAAAMRYIAECAGYGYVLYQQGKVSPGKLLGLVEKFDDAYGVLASPGAREYARSRGRACARLVAFPSGEKDGDESWFFWLMSTEGSGKLDDGGNTHDARDPATRLTWGKQYELAARPVLRRRDGLRHVWTWAFSEANYRAWQERLKTAAGRVRSSVERKPDYLRQQVDFLRRVPGFQAINRQKRALITGADIPAEWYQQLDLRHLGTVVDSKQPAPPHG